MIKDLLRPGTGEVEFSTVTPLIAGSQGRTYLTIAGIPDVTHGRNVLYLQPNSYSGLDGDGRKHPELVFNVPADGECFTGITPQPAFSEGAKTTADGKASYIYTILLEMTDKCLGCQERPFCPIGNPLLRSLVSIVKPLS